jgi:hypothetical protein
MSDYDLRPGGSLKLKGVAEGGIVKKYVYYVSYMRPTDLTLLQEKEKV